MKDGQLHPCTCCLSKDNVIECLKKAIEIAKRDGQKKLARGLRAVLKFLPDDPVMAAMEAEHRKMDDVVIEIIRQSFDVLPFK
jgi:hypothetical protein